MSDEAPMSGKGKSSKHIYADPISPALAIEPPTLRPGQSFEVIWALFPVLG